VVLEINHLDSLQNKMRGGFLIIGGIRLMCKNDAKEVATAANLTSFDGFLSQIICFSSILTAAIWTFSDEFLIYPSTEGFVFTASSCNSSEGFLINTIELASLFIALTLKI
jgi:hypothetical protein